MQSMSHAVSDEDLELLYEKIVAMHPTLSKAIDNIMLVATEKGKDIWVITKGNDGQVGEALRWVLFKLVDRRLSFAGSQRFDFAIKEAGVSILKQMKD